MKYPLSTAYKSHDYVYTHSQSGYVSIVRDPECPLLAFTGRETLSRKPPFGCLVSAVNDRASKQLTSWSGADSVFPDLRKGANIRPMESHDGGPLPTVSQVSEGHYTAGGDATLLMEAVITTAADTIAVAGNNTTTAEQLEADTSLTSTRSAERLCEPGFWCEAGFRYPCEAGAYGSDFGATRGNCSGFCEAGFVCRNGSTSPEENPCGVSGEA